MQIFSDIMKIRKNINSKYNSDIYRDRSHITLSSGYITCRDPVKMRGGAACGRNDKWFYQSRDQ